MFEKSLEWIAAQKSRRFQLYRDARFAYESYLAEYPISFAQLADENYLRASADERLRSAERGYREAITLTRAAEAPYDLAVVLSQLGFLLHLCGRFADSRDALSEGVHVLGSMARSEADQQRTLSSCQYHLGLLNLQEGHYAAARRRLNSSLAIDIRLGDLSGQAMNKAALELCPAEDGSPEPPYTPDTISSLSHDASIGPDDEPEPDYLAAPDESVDLPSIFGATAREAIWIMAATETSVTQLRETVQRACPQNRELIILAAASQSGALTPPPMEAGTSLCGAIFEISPAALSNDDFRYWIGWAINRAFEATDFRLFVHLNGISEAEFVELSTRDTLIAELRDKVQMHRPDRLDLLEVNLRSHLLRLEMTRDAAKWRWMRRVTIQLLGSASAVILWLAVAFWLGVSASALVLGKARVAIFLLNKSQGKDWLGVLGGVPLAWSLLISVALAVQGWKRRTLISVPLLTSVRWVVLGTVVARASIWLPREVHAPARVLILGGILGLLLETARRGAAALARSSLLQSGREIADMRSLPSSLLQRGSGNPRQWPLFASGSKIFISYSRSSPWGSRSADLLHQRLRIAGRDSFLDRLSIPPGASWQHQLDEQIGTADVFIALCDEHTVQRPWVAAEVAAALEGRHLSGLPEIILVKDKTITSSALASSLPIFRAVFEEAMGAEEGAPQVVSADDEASISHLAASMVPRRLARPSVFPSWLRTLLLALASPLMLLASLVPLLGLPSLIVWIGVKLGKVDLYTWFKPAILWWLAIAVAAALGTTVRQAIAARFDGLSKQQGRSISSLLIVCAIGFGMLGVQLWLRLDGIGILWAVAALWLGWIVTAVFAGELSGKRPDPAKRPHI